MEGGKRSRRKKENCIICPDIRSAEYLTSPPDAPDIRRVSRRCSSRGASLIRSATHWHFATPSFIPLSSSCSSLSLSSFALAFITPADIFLSIFSMLLSIVLFLVFQEGKRCYVARGIRGNTHPQPIPDVALRQAIFFFLSARRRLPSRKFEARIAERERTCSPNGSPVLSDPPRPLTFFSLARQNATSSLARSFARVHDRIRCGKSHGKFHER